MSVQTNKESDFDEVVFPTAKYFKNKTDENLLTLNSLRSEVLQCINDASINGKYQCDFGVVGKHGTYTRKINHKRMELIKVIQTELNSQKFKTELCVNLHIDWSSISE